VSWSGSSSLGPSSQTDGRLVTLCSHSHELAAVNRTRKELSEFRDISCRGFPKNPV
jgi:hypothetical protein